MRPFAKKLQSLEEHLALNTSWLLHKTVMPIGQIDNSMPGKERKSLHQIKYYIKSSLEYWQATNLVLLYRQEHTYCTTCG